MQPATSSPRTRFTLTLIGMLLLGLVVPAWPSGDTPLGRASLKGIGALYVVVEHLRPDAERDGLTKDQLQTDVELRLRKASIRVTSLAAESEWSYLYLNVNTYKHPSGLYAFHIRLEFTQRVILERNRNVSLYATTWSEGDVGIVGAQRLPHLRDRVADVVDRFINAYLEQNPKQ